MDKIFENSIIRFIEELKRKIYNLTYDDGQKPFIRNSIIPAQPEIFSFSRLEEIAASTLSILIKVYGENNQHVKDFIEKNNSLRRAFPEPYQKLLNCCIGKLTAIESDIRFGMLKTIEREVIGQIFGDFINAAKSSINDGHKEISAVLACAALEDLLKKLANLNGLDVEDKTMSDVVNALKSVGIIKGAQTNLMSAYVTLRNKTLHAQWDKIENADIKSLIAFTEEMLIKHFS